MKLYFPSFLLTFSKFLRLQSTSSCCGQRLSLKIFIRGRKKMTSGKNFLLTPPPPPLDFFQTSKSQKKVKKILGSPPRHQKTEKNFRGLRPRTPPVKKLLQNLKTFPGASPPDPPKESKNNFTSTKMLKNSLKISKKFLGSFAPQTPHPENQ